MSQGVEDAMATMEELIAAFPQNITEAVEIANNSSFKTPKNKIASVVICGMGGSGIGGQLVSTWIANEIPVPIDVINDYSIPAYVSQNTLVIGSSYSGNTEETLSAIEEAHQKGAHIIGVCSGGRLEEFCKSNGMDVVIVPGGNPPRTALAYSLIQLLNIFGKLGMIKDKLSDMLSARELIVNDESDIKAAAHELADFLKGDVGIFYGATQYAPVLVRARQQFNENSKYLCWHHTIPEMNHNELVGWGGGDTRFATVFFEADDIQRRNVKRFQISKEVIDKKSGKIFTLRSKGNTLIERSIYFINIVDWASLYLAQLKDQDPIDIAVIDYLKGSLANYK